MNSKDFMDVIKREGRYGSPSITNDRATTDILNSINIRRKAIWAKWDWKWALEPLATPMIIGQRNYSISSKSGALVSRITDLIPQDRTVTPPILGFPLTQLERQDFYAWVANSESTGDVPSKYVNLGLDSNGKWKVEIWPPPATVFTMAGFAKGILEDITLANILANDSFGYFPDGIIEVLLKTGVLSDIERINGDKEEAARLDISFENKLDEKVQQQSNAGRDDSGITSPVPDSYRWLKRMRRGSTVV